MLPTRNGITKAVITTIRSGSALPPLGVLSLTSLPTTRTNKTRLSEYYTIKDHDKSSYYLPRIILRLHTTHSVGIPPRSDNATAVVDIDVDGSAERRSSSSVGGGDDSLLPRRSTIEHRERPTTISTRMDFANPASAHGTKSTIELLRAIVIFYTCRIPFIVEYSETLLDLSTRIVGRRITDALLKVTFFRHFCAGEDTADMKPVVDRLLANGVGPILDYAAEADVVVGHDPVLYSSSEDGTDDSVAITTRLPFNQPARVYDYTTEEECDRHVDVFLSCIRSVREITNDNDDDDGKGGIKAGFAAIKVTALGNPALLERMSTVITEARKLFSKFDSDNNGRISRDEFMQCHDASTRTEIFNYLLQVDPYCSNNDADEEIDYISFSKLFTPYTIGKFTSSTCKEFGPLALATPSDHEVALLIRTSERLNTLAKEAAQYGTRLLIDAEHQKYQPAIDNLVLELQRKYNDKAGTDKPVIFNTYQCYLKDSKERAMTDLTRSERYNFHFAAKLVRGAYMIHERERATMLNIDDPIHDTANATHCTYDEVVELLLRYRANNGPGLEIMVASHNEQSIRNATALMNELGLAPDDDCVHFAQLLGMSDHLTYTLGNAGYSAFKYLPYGKVREVVPYLIRRAQENGDVLGNTGKELDLLHKELWRRTSFA